MTQLRLGRADGVDGFAGATVQEFVNIKTTAGGIRQQGVGIEVWDNQVTILGGKSEGNDVAVRVGAMDGVTIISHRGENNLTHGVQFDRTLAMNGTITAVSADFLTFSDTSKTFRATEFVSNYDLVITSGVGTGQSQTITGNDATSVTVGTPFTTPPAAGDAYRITARYGSRMKMVGTMGLSLFIGVAQDRDLAVGVTGADVTDNGKNTVLLGESATDLSGIKLLGTNLGQQSTSNTTSGEVLWDKIKKLMFRRSDATGTEQGPVLHGQRDRAGALPGADDRLLVLRGDFYTGSAYASVAGIELKGRGDGTPSVSSYPTAIRFQATPSASTAMETVAEFRADRAEFPKPLRLTDRPRHRMLRLQTRPTSTRRTTGRAKPRLSSSGQTGRRPCSQPRGRSPRGCRGRRQLHTPRYE